MADAVTAAEAAAHFLNSTDPDKARDARPAVDRFVEWYGGDRPMGELSGETVRAYSEYHDDDDETTLEPVRGFLAYSARMAFTERDLVSHLPIGGAAGGAAGVALGNDGYQVTIEGLQSLEREVEELKGRRPEIADTLRLAMADKDFRENAPLDAARDEQAHLEARIREIEDHLRRAVIIGADTKGGRANVGSTVRILNLDSGDERTFHLVSPSEVDPGQNKISTESPYGAAMIDHIPGDEVTVHAPNGVLKLRMLEVID